MLEVRLKDFVSRVLFGGIFTDYLDRVLDLLAMFEGEGFFDDAEATNSDLAADNIGADFLTFVVRGRSGRGRLCKARQPL